MSLIPLTTKDTITADEREALIRDRKKRPRSRGFHFSAAEVKDKTASELVSMIYPRDRFPGGLFDPEATSKIAAFNTAWGVGPRSSKRRAVGRERRPDFCLDTLEHVHENTEAATGQKCSRAFWAYSPKCEWALVDYSMRGRSFQTKAEWVEAVEEQITS